MTLGEVLSWVPGVPAGLPAKMQQMAQGLVDTLVDMARCLVELRLRYLALDRAGATVLVLDEPSVGLHPLDVRTLLVVLRTLAGGADPKAWPGDDVQKTRTSAPTTCSSCRSSCGQ